MSGKKQKLLRKYLRKRNAENKVELTDFGKDGHKNLRRHSIKREIKNSYNSASHRGKTLLTGFFKEIINKTPDKKEVKK